MYFRILRTITVPTLILGVGLAIPAFAQSQLPPRPNVVVNLAALPANGQQPGNSSLVGFTASNAKGRKLLEVTPDQQIEISPDGKSELMADSANTQSGDSLSFGPIGQKLTAIPVDGDQHILWSAFSPDGRFLTFTSASLDSEAWVLGLVEISSGNRVEFAGDFGDPTKGPFPGVANAVAWSADGKRLFVQNYQPFSATGNFDSLYALDISGIHFDKPGRGPFPSATRLLKDGEEISNFAISDDGSKLAVSFASNASSSSGAEQPLPNTVSIRDLNSNVEIMSYKPDSGKAIAYPLNWTPDGQKLVFATGIYQDATFSGNANLIVADVSSKQVTITPLSTDDPHSEYEDAAVCGDTLFYTTSKSTAPDEADTATLYSAPLSDLKTAAKLQSAWYINVLGCVADTGK